MTQEQKGWAKEFEKEFVDGFSKKFNRGSYFAELVDFIRTELVQARLSAQEEERERILDDAHCWFETHFTPEDPEVGMFKGIQEHLSEREFVKLVRNPLSRQKIEELKEELKEEVSK